MTWLPYRRLILSAATVALTLSIAACNGAAATPPATAGVGSTGDCPTSQPDPLPLGQTRHVTLDTDQGRHRHRGQVGPVADRGRATSWPSSSCGYYDGSSFHRVVPGFVIQGGVKADGSRLELLDPG